MKTPWAVLLLISLLLSIIIVAKEITELEKKGNDKTELGQKKPNGLVDWFKRLFSGKKTSDEIIISVTESPQPDTTTEEFQPDTTTTGDKSDERLDIADTSASTKLLDDATTNSPSTIADVSSESLKDDTTGTPVSENASEKHKEKNSGENGDMNDDTTELSVEMDSITTYPAESQEDGHSESIESETQNETTLSPVTQEELQTITEVDTENNLTSELEQEATVTQQEQEATVTQLEQEATVTQLEQEATVTQLEQEATVTQLEQEATVTQLEQEATDTNQETSELEQTSFDSTTKFADITNIGPEEIKDELSSTQSVPEQDEELLDYTDTLQPTKFDVRTYYKDIIASIPRLYIENFNLQKADMMERLAKKYGSQR